MRTAPPALMPLLRSQVQAELLALTYLQPDREFTLTEAATAIGASVKAVQQEVTRLVTAGILRDRRLGTARMIRSVQDSVLTGPLTDLLAVSYGPLPVLTDVLGGVQGVERAFIYGSWAARYQGEVGPPPADVDVLVVGDVDLDLLDDLARRAEARLGGRRPVDIRRVRSATWEEPSNAFLDSLRSRPLVELKLTRPGDSA